MNFHADMSPRLASVRLKKIVRASGQAATRTNTTSVGVKKNQAARTLCCASVAGARLGVFAWGALGGSALEPARSGWSPRFRPSTRALAGAAVSELAMALLPAAAVAQPLQRSFGIGEV